MDFEPLSPVPGIDPAAVPDGGMVARLRYQQTKVDGAPMTILVGGDVVQIIREQQQWVRGRWGLGPDGTARYLFPRLTGNRKATRAWETGHYDLMLREFSEVVALLDSEGRDLSFSRSHRLRHTKATTLQLIEHRKEQHLARYGEPMTETNIWLEQRITEVRSMRLEISALDALADNTLIRGPGVCGRPGYQSTAAVPVTITGKPEPS